MFTLSALNIHVNSSSKVTIICFHDQVHATVLDIQKEKAVKFTLHLTQSIQGERPPNLRWQVKRVNVRHYHHPHPDISLLSPGSFLQTSLPSVPFLQKAPGLCNEGWPQQPAVSLFCIVTPVCRMKCPLPPHRCAVSVFIFKRAETWQCSQFVVQTQAVEIQWISMWTCSLTLNIIEATR